MLSKVANLTPAAIALTGILVDADPVNEPVLQIWNYLGGELRWGEAALVIELLDPPDVGWALEGLMLIRQTINDFKKEL